MAARKKARKVKGRRQRGFFGKLISLLIICAAVFIGMTVFFKVTNIRVEGSARYSSEEVAAVSGVQTGDQLIFLSSSSVVMSIKSALPYVDEVSVGRRLPGTLVITITESTPLAYVEDAGSYWLLDKSARLLENVSAADLGSAPPLTGITPLQPEAGKVIDTGEDDGKAAYLAEMLTGLNNLGLAENVTAIDISSAANPTFDYLDRFTVKLGAQTDVAYKLQMLQSVLDKLGERESGTIDLSDTSGAHFYRD